ncbi:MAG TPA: hypothetical protein VGI55_18170 [Solirubrobacteraceae bacterium]|jgi:hypothetical protein
MIRALVDHARRQVIAYCALGCSVLALGGTAYAQFLIPNGSVGERQLRNYAIDPVKWDPAYVTGFVRRWATVNAAGALLSTSRGGQSKAIGTGSYAVTWSDAFAGWCAPIATVLGGSLTPPPSTTTTTTATTTTTTTGTTTTPQPTPTSGAYADASIVTRSGQSTVVAIATYNSLGQPANEPFSLAVACGPGAGSGQTVPSNLP